MLQQDCGTFCYQRVWQSHYEFWIIYCSFEFISELENIGLTSLLHCKRIAKDQHSESSNFAKQTSEAYLQIAQFCRKILEERTQPSDLGESMCCIWIIFHMLCWTCFYYSLFLFLPFSIQMSPFTNIWWGLFFLVWSSDQVRQDNYSLYYYNFQLYHLNSPKILKKRYFFFFVLIMKTFNLM